MIDDWLHIGTNNFEVKLIKINHNANKIILKNNADAFDIFY